MAKYPLGLALSGGAIKGFAHIGVLKAMEEHDLRPDIISGTSAGALVGAFYADGYTPDEIFELLSHMSLTGMTSLSVLSILDGGGLLLTDKFTEYLRKHLRHNKLEELPIPLRVVATNLDEGKQEIFTEGCLPEIITASCTVPILFHPILIDGVSYVDGGLYRNFPVSVIRKQADFIIGMNLGPEREYANSKKSIVGVAQRSWELIFRQNTRPDKQACDLLLETQEVLKYKMFDISVAREIMEIGYKLANERLTTKQINGN